MVRNPQTLCLNCYCPWPADSRGAPLVINLASLMIHCYTWCNHVSVARTTGVVKTVPTQIVYGLTRSYVIRALFQTIDAKLNNYGLKTQLTRLCYRVNNRTDIK